MRQLVPVVILAGCSEFTVNRAPPPPVADPPGSAADPWGDPPDWGDCPTRFDGSYYNLPGDHADLRWVHEEQGDTGAEALAAVDDPETVDWWDDAYAAFDRTDATLDMGGDWWPVDDGLAGDPAGFAARWRAWIRVTDGGTHRLRLGASTDAFLLIEGEVVASVTAADGFTPRTVEVDLDSGQKRMELRFAHRGGESGLSFLPLSDEVQICVGEEAADTGG